MKIVPPSKNNYRFSFLKYCNYILSVIPNEDLIGISEIRFVDKFSHSKSGEDSIASYLQGENGKNAIIEINTPNLVKHRIHDYLLNLHPEISALLLSEIIYHEIGHHVHTFKRHKIKKGSHEKFADNYAQAGYYQYLTSRLNKILSSYKWGSRMFFIYDKKTRENFAKAIVEIENWIDANKNSIPFP